MKITKKQIKRIQEGNYDTLMECIEFLLDTFEEDKFDNGYKSCLSDMSVRAHQLAKHISIESVKKGKKASDGVYFFYEDELAKVIEDYFNNALKTEEDGK